MSFWKHNFTVIRLYLSLLSMETCLEMFFFWIQKKIHQQVSMLLLCEAHNIKNECYIYRLANRKNLEFRFGGGFLKKFTWQSKLNIKMAISRGSLMDFCNSNCTVTAIKSPKEEHKMNQVEVPLWFVWNTIYFGTTIGAVFLRNCTKINTLAKSKTKGQVRQTAF